MDRFKESRVAAEAAKFAEEMNRKIEKERTSELIAIIDMAKKSPIIITVCDDNGFKNELILYNNKGKLEVATPDKMEPVFRSMTELGEYITKTNK